MKRAMTWWKVSVGRGFVQVLPWSVDAHSISPQSVRITMRSEPSAFSTRQCSAWCPRDSSGTANPRRSYAPSVVSAYTPQPVNFLSSGKVSHPNGSQSFGKTQVQLSPSALVASTT